MGSASLHHTACIPSRCLRWAQAMGHHEASEPAPQHHRQEQARALLWLEKGLVPKSFEKLGRKKGKLLLCAGGL